MTAVKVLGLMANMTLLKNRNFVWNLLLLQSLQVACAMYPKEEIRRCLADPYCIPLKDFCASSKTNK